jgi:hypothetical protein
LHEVRSIRPVVLLALILPWSVPAQCVAQSARTGPAHVSSAHPARMRVQTEGNLSVEFFPLADGPQILGTQAGGVLNLGNVSYAGRPEHSGVSQDTAKTTFSVETPIGIKIGSGNFAGATASLKAWLQTSAAPYLISLDAVPLTLQPMLIQPRTQLGVVTRHELKITVPRNTSESQSQFRAMISVQVIRN